MASSNLIKAIAVTAQIYGKQFSEDAARVFAGDLEQFPESSVLAALSRCRRELRTFPTLADIIARIDDGRPGVEEAWAMIPKDDMASVVWTEEMCEAFAAARKLLEADPIAARMVFKEVYLKLICDARANRRPAKWQPSFGYDREGRAVVLREAVHKGRLSREHACEHMPELATGKYPELAGPRDPGGLAQFDVSALIPKMDEPGRSGQ